MTDIMDRGDLERMSRKALVDLVIAQANQVDLLRRERNEENYRQAGSRHQILVLLTEHADCLRTCDLGIEIREILGASEDGE